MLSETAGAGNARAAALHCGGIELLVGPARKLRYVNLQNWGHGVWHFAHQKGLVDRDAQSAMDHRRARGRLAKVNQHVAWSAPGRRRRSTA